MLTIRNITKTYSTKNSKRLIYSGLNLDFPTGSFTTVFGPNGCGKSTLAKVIAGLETYDSGEIIGISEIKNSIGFVFQDYRRALLPWATVYENIVFPLTLKSISKNIIAERCAKLIKLTNINLDLKQRIISLSGGQAQLVSILRALIIDPKLLILDEPFAALDYQNTISLREKLSELAFELGLTVIFISHDLDEAIALGDRVVFLSKPPTTVNEILEVNLPKPRKITLETSDIFRLIKANALKIWEAETRA